MFWNNLILNHKPGHDLEIQDTYKYKIPKPEMELKLKFESTQNICN